MVAFVGRGFVAAAAAVAACVAPAGAQARPAAAAYVCDNEARFSVEFLGPLVRVTTASGAYLLRHRRSSIGRRYSSGAATFIQDQDRAALNGLPGGPFRRCHEADGGVSRAEPVVRAGAHDVATEEDGSARTGHDPQRRST